MSSTPLFRFEAVAVGVRSWQRLEDVGPALGQVAWGINDGSLGDITDGMSRTLAIVEATPDNAVPWTKPDDLEFDPERPLAGVGNPRRPGGLFLSGFFDGSVRTIIAEEVDPEVFRALVTPSGGEPVGLD